MDRIKIKFINDEMLDKPFSWGIHRELSKYLAEDGNLMTMFTNTEVTDNVLQICLSERNKYGEIIKPFVNTNNIDVSSMMEFLEGLHNYFEDFFFQNQQRIHKMEQKFQEQVQITNQ